MPSFDNMSVDVTVVLGRTRMPLHMLLRLGRGAVISLDADSNDMVEILANDHPIARGQVVVTGTSISVELTEMILKPDVVSGAGLTIGDAAIASHAAAEDDTFFN